MTTHDTRTKRWKSLFDIHLGPVCPKGMYNFNAQCYGIVRNSQTNTPDDSNCNWQSDDPYMTVAEISNNPVR